MTDGSDEPETWGRLTPEEIEDWCDANGPDMVDLRDSENAIVATWGNGREVWFYGNGMVVLRQYRPIGGAEPEDTVERQGDRLVVTDENGTNYVSGDDFPIERW